MRVNVRPLFIIYIIIIFELQSEIRFPMGRNDSGLAIVRGCVLVPCCFAGKREHAVTGMIS